MAGFRRAATSAQSLPVWIQDTGVPRPNALSAQSRQVGPGVAQAPRKVTACHGQPHPCTPYKYHFLCVLCHGAALADALGMMAELARRGRRVGGVILGGGTAGAVAAGLLLPEE